MRENPSSEKMGAILWSCPFMPSLNLVEADAWRQLGEQAVASGVTAVEVLLRSSHATRSVKLLKEHFPTLKVGLGTILTTSDWEQAEDCGADFIVSPGLLPELLDRAEKSGRAYLPGVMSPSEIMQAAARGFIAQKLFPAAHLQPSFLKCLEGPFPFLRLSVAGGVTADNWSGFVGSPLVVSIGGNWILPQPAAGLTQMIEKLETGRRAFACRQ